MKTNLIDGVNWLDFDPKYTDVNPLESVFNIDQQDNLMWKII